MVDLTCEAVDDTAQAYVACLGFRNIPRPVGQTPQIESHERGSLKVRLVTFDCICLIRIERQNACLVIHHSTNQMQIESNETNVGGVVKILSLRRN